MSHRNIRKQQEDFVKEVDKLVNQPHFTLKSFAKDVDDHLNTWKIKVSGALTDSEEVKQLKKMKGMLDAINEVSKGKDVTKMGRRDKLKITAMSGSDPKDINDTIDAFSRMKTMHSWLRKRKDAGQKMPETQEDAQRLMTLDMKAGDNNTGASKRYMNTMKKQASRRSGRGR